MSFKVFLNPGHDPVSTYIKDKDHGAEYDSYFEDGSDLYENEVAAEVSAKVRKILEEKGVIVDEIQSPSLSEIASLANNSGADIFVSIHCNAFNAIAHGTETLIYSFGSYGEKLGHFIQDEIVKNLGTFDRGLKERPGLYVIKHTDMPSVLVETAFIDRKEEADLLYEQPHKFAKAIADGILKYAGYDLEGDSSISSSSLVAPNGKEFEKNDIDYLLGQGYDMASALSFLAQSDKYSNSQIAKAVKWADERVGTQGYGNNGCTAFVRDFLLEAGHWFGQLMQDGSQGNLMWVPNIMEYAKANNMWKEPEEGGCAGDICLLETNYDWGDGPDHVVIACGDGQYWGNSSSRNRIVKSGIAHDYGGENVWGYVSTGTTSNSSVVSGKAERSAAEIVGDAGSTSFVPNLAPNGMVYEENDITYLINSGYSRADAIDFLSKSEKYTTKARISPNGKPYEWNDIKYLLDQGYTEDAAIAFLSTADKYLL